MFKDLPTRHTIRLQGYNYSESNLYYVTICTHERKSIFGDVILPVPNVGARPASPV